MRRIEGHGGLVERGNAVGPVRIRVRVVEDDGDYLAEAESHDRQVVAAEPQRGRAQQQSEDRRHGRSYQEHRPERDRVMGERRSPVRICVGADGEEGRVAQVQQAGQAHDHVQADRQQHPDTSLGEAVNEAGLVVEARERRQQDDERQQRSHDRHADDDRERLVGVEESAGRGRDRLAP